uniref:Uncharacterized protein n=1 Tax=Rhizophora mucronata TaxID=61149 RepID=A0A2P2NCC6_RHIMU
MTHTHVCNMRNPALQLKSYFAGKLQVIEPPCNVWCHASLDH